MIYQWDDVESTAGPCGVTVVYVYVVGVVRPYTGCAARVSCDLSWRIVYVPSNLVVCVGIRLLDYYTLLHFSSICESVRVCFTVFAPCVIRKIVLNISVCDLLYVWLNVRITHLRNPYVFEGNHCATTVFLFSNIWFRAVTIRVYSHKRYHVVASSTYRLRLYEWTYNFSIPWSVILTLLLLHMCCLRRVQVLLVIGACNIYCWCSKLDIWVWSSVS